MGLTFEGPTLDKIKCGTTNLARDRVNYSWVRINICVFKFLFKLKIQIMQIIILIYSRRLVLCLFLLCRIPRPLILWRAWVGPCLQVVDVEGVGYLLGPVLMRHKHRGAIQEAHCTIKSFKSFIYSYRASDCALNSSNAKI